MGERTDERGGDLDCAGRLKAEFEVKGLGLDHPSPQLFVSSVWGCPGFYVGWRVVWAAYHVAWVLYDLVDNALEEDRPGTWPIFLTNWGFVLLTLATLGLAIQQLHVQCTGKEFKEGEMEWYMKVTWVLYTLSSVAAFIITVLFFGLLFNGEWELLSTVKHLGTSIYVLLDFAVTATPVRLLHIVYPLILAVVYLVFTVVYWAAGGVNDKGEPFIYEPLDWDDPKKAGPMAVGIVFVGTPLAHGAFWSLYMLKVVLCHLLDFCCCCCCRRCSGKDRRNEIV